MNGEYEFNTRIYVFGVIGVLLIFCIFFLPPILEKPKTIPVINISVNITSTPTPIIEYVYITPTPDNGIYYASEYQSGVRKLQRPFSFYREKALGEKDLSVHITVYDYKTFSKYHWFNPSDYLYYTKFPQSPNNKFLFVFINTYLDDIIGDDTRFWIPSEKSFAVQVSDRVYSPISFEKQLRIKELEETFNLNDNNRIGYYNSYLIYSPTRNDSNTAGETTNNIDVLKGGKSNAIDGYLVFEIPKGAQEKDISVLGNFYTFGSSQWRLNL